MSAPFPQSVNPTYDELTRSQKAYFVRINGSIRGLVPSFYQPHQSPSTTTVRDGEAILLAEIDGRPFTVEEMPIERRWAVREDGEILPQHEFQRCYNLWFDDYYRQIGIDDPEAKVQVGDFKRAPIPSVLNYVTKQVDPRNPEQLVPMHYDPERTRGSVPEHLADSEGETRPALEVLQEAYADPRLRTTLKPHEIALVEKSVPVLRTPNAEVAALRAELAELKALMKPVKKKVRSKVSETEKKFAAPPVPCGKVLRGVTAQKATLAARMHAMHCRECKDGDTT
jgi:hypothetical protein